MSKTITELVKEAYETAKEKGWHDVPATFGDRIALCHSELSEALEAYRDTHHGMANPFDPIYSREGRLTRFPYEYVVGEGNSDIKSVGMFTDITKRYEIHPDDKVELNKPEGVIHELADVVIRIMDMCGLYGMDLEAAIDRKMEYNKTRPYRHGGKKL